MEPDKFKAIHNFFPPQPPTLTVTGSVEVPTPGWKLELTKAEPQGINPDILLLNLKRTPPDGIEPQHLVTMSVRYEETTSVKYTQVTIHPDDVTVPVENVY